MPEQFLLASDGANLHSISPDGTTALIAGGLAAGSYWEWVKAPVIGGQGPFYGVNGVTPYQWTGVGSAASWTATIGTVPVGRYILYHGNRVWITGLPADGSALWFSNIGDPRDWPAANVVRFDPQDGEAISGIGVAGPYLLVFKPSKVWLVTDLDTGANRLISRNIGCAAHRTIVDTPYGTFFLTPRDGVMIANQNNTQLLSDNQRVSDQIRSTIDSLPRGQLYLANAIYFDHHYYLSVIGPSGARWTLDYDVRLQSWWIHTVGAQQMVAWDPSADGSAGQRIYAAMRDIAQIRRLFVPGVTTDAGASFAAYWSGPFHTFGKPAVRKRCREMHIDGTGTVSVALARDFEEPSGVAGTGFTGTQLVEDARVYTPGVGRSWGVKFSNDTASTFEIHSYTMAMTERTD